MMREDEIFKSTDIILRSIASDNMNLYLKIKEQYQTLSTTKIFTILLQELNYSTDEIVIILGITLAAINNTTKQVNKLKSN